MLPWNGNSTPCRRPISSTHPMVRSIASIGSVSSPNVSARWKRTSESVEPCTPANSSGATASIRSRRSCGKPLTTPLCTNSQRSCANGWQLVSCTAVPEVARTCERNSGAAMCAARWRRLASPQAGRTLRYTPGPSPRPYHPTPKPSPFVVSAPRRECRLWSTSPCWVLNRSSSSSTGCPCQAIHRHIAVLLRVLGVVLREQLALLVPSREEEVDERPAQQDGDQARRVGPLVAVEERVLGGRGDLARVLGVLLCDPLGACERLGELVLRALADLRGVRRGGDRGRGGGGVARGEQGAEDRLHDRPAKVALQVGGARGHARAAHGDGAGQRVRGGGAGQPGAGARARGRPARPPG